MAQYTLNSGQQAAADAFLGFMLSPEKSFVISGTAGVGKTFLMQHFANVGMKAYEGACALVGLKPQYFEAVFTATTNKAAEVLEGALGKPVRTIHSFLNLRVKDDYKTGAQSLFRTKDWRQHERKVIFIDECSMIDQALYKEILEGCSNCKLVFVGDHAQMAPVGEPYSALYVSVLDEYTAVLTEPVRNAGQPALVALCQQLRETVETGVFRPIHGVPGIIDFLSKDEMEAKLYETFTDLNPSSRILTYTNDRVKLFNAYIREEVRKQPPHFCVGDVAVVGQSYQNGKAFLSVEREVRIADLGQPEEDTFFGGFPVTYRQAALGTPDNFYAGDSNCAIFKIPEYPEQIEVMLRKLASNREWSAYFQAKNTFVDLRDKAACTVYKAQGSTYDNVFVDLGNIGTSYDAAQVARMLFVAISRARNRVYLFGQLPPRYNNSKGKALWKVATSTAS